MPRNMSFMLTTDQIRNKTKTVTRRVGWKFLKHGEILNACVKCQGLKKGESPEKICQIRVIDTRIEQLWEMLRDTEYGKRDCDREGFPEMEPKEFVEMFCKHMSVKPVDLVTRIQFEYIDVPY